MTTELLTDALVAHAKFFAEEASVNDAPEMRNWLTASGPGGVWPGLNPITAWKPPIITGDYMSYLAHIKERWQQRTLGFNLLDPKTKGLAPNQYGMTCLDAEHFDCVQLIDLALCGIPWIAPTCAELALNLLTGAYINLGAGYYLRPESPGATALGTNGRNRKLAANFRWATASIRLLWGFGFAQKWKDALLVVIHHHVKNAEENFPFVDAPKDDHLPIPHIPAFNLGVLSSAASEMSNALREIAKGQIPELDRLADDALSLGLSAYRGDHFVYDIPFDGNKPMDPWTPSIQALMDAKHSNGSWKQRQYGALQSHVWLTDAMVRQEEGGQGTHSALELQRTMAEHAHLFEGESPWPLLRWFRGKRTA